MDASVPTLEAILSRACPRCESGRLLVQEIHLMVRHLTLRCRDCGHLEHSVDYTPRRRDPDRHPHAIAS